MPGVETDPAKSDCGLTERRLDTAQLGAISVMPNRPHYLLLSEASGHATDGTLSHGRWRFVLESMDGQVHLEASDREPDVGGERLELLTVVRGLEAVDQPARVTLVTHSRYVARGLRFGLQQWRRTDWCWEHDGQMIPIKNQDLWQRLDHALNYHQVQCRWLRIDRPRSVAHPVAATLARTRPHPARLAIWHRWSRDLRERVQLVLLAVSGRIRLHPAA
jgi:ribonuclease HI